MRPRIALFVTLALLTACGLPRVSREEAEEAFVAAFGGAYIGSMSVQLGRALDGVELREETDEMLFDSFRIGDLGTRYSTLSGSAQTTSTNLIGDFTLSEGPVETIAFELSVDQMRSQTIEATVTVNGREVEISINAGQDYSGGQ